MLEIQIIEENLCCRNKLAWLGASALEFSWQQCPGAKMQIAVGLNELDHSIYLNLSLKSPSKWINYIDNGLSNVR